MPDFCLPDLGEGLTEAEIVAWHVHVGDEVEIDQIVVEVETAKAIVEVPIPFSGVVSALHGEAGSVLAVGSSLISVASADVETGAESSGNVLIGYGTRADTIGHRRRSPRSTRAPRAVQPSVAEPAPAAAPTAHSAPVTVISPLVRRLARDGGLDLRAVHGTGADGLVLRRDVDRALEQQVRASADAQTKSSAPHPSDLGQAQVRQQPAEQRIPIHGIRKVVADKLSRSRREIPEATVWVDVDATELLAARSAMNARRPEEPVSVLALFARIAMLGLRKYPELNGRVESSDSGPAEIVLPTGINLGFAAQTDRGLMVPVVKDAHLLTTRELSTTLTRYTTASRAGALSPADLTGGTFTVNNYGVFGVDGSAAIINYPEVAILGLGRIIDRPWVVAGTLAVRKVTQLTLTFDHRVCDGATAGGFLRFVADCVESPIIALGEV
ncbi:dihydrolipoamide acetyltransferase family protein [Jatrophihabitans sp. DSM 45814]